MGLFRRPPAEVTALLSPGERPLAWGVLSGGGQVVATDGRLHATDHGLDVPWVQILAAAWDEPVLEVRLLSVAGEESLRLVLEDPGRVPEVVRERVEQSLMVDKVVPIVGKLGVRFLARRDPVGDEVFWQRVVDPGLDVTDAAVAAAVDSAEAELRSIYGV